MGNTLKEMRSNDELVDFLVSVDFIKSKKIQLVFRAVDRKLYLPQDHKDIYKDVAIKVKHFHLSSPSVYATVLENLDLRPGLSFLNIGSGSGYLSTMVGLLLGCSGINHGIELYHDVVDFAEKRVKSFIEASHTTDFSNFGEPLFTVGNFFNLLNPDQKYDRVYCGGACPEKYLSLLFQLVKDDGILIRATEDSLLKLRSREGDWNEEFLLSVSFFNLVSPDSDTPVMLKDVQTSGLQNICRSYIRSRFKDNIKREQCILKNEIQVVSPDYYSPNNDQNYGEYLISDPIPRNIDVLFTRSLQRFLIKDIQRKRINEDHDETQPISDSADDSIQTLKTGNLSSSLDRKHKSPKKNLLIHPEQKAKTAELLPEKFNPVPSTSKGLNNSLLKTGGEKNEYCQELPQNKSTQKCNKQASDRNFSEDNMKQQSEPMTGIDNSEKEFEVDQGSNSNLWHKLPNFEVLQKSSSLIKESFSELMNHKIQDLPLTQSLKDFLR